jgi:RNA-directed DNA polymerase
MQSDQGACAPGKSRPNVSHAQRGSATHGTNPKRPGGAATSSVQERGTPVNTRNPGNKTAMQEMMMEQAVEAGNWEAALSSVERNAGAPGPDGMKSRELREHLAKHGAGIKAKLLQGRFKPGAARRKEIPKPNGGTRPLSIPNVLDRFVQQLLLQGMQPLFEPHFSEASHGFRPGRSAHGAIEAAQRHAREGKDWVVDMDITKFFDEVNHDILMAQVSRVVKDKRVLQLIGRFLRAGVILPEGCHVRSEKGTPQGGPLSPLLANIYLDQLDKELERRGLAHVRYADDCNIYVSSQQAAARVLEVISQWIGRKLRLQVNAEKSGTGRVWERKFLGFILTISLLIAVSPQAVARFKDQVRAKWDARQSMSSEQLRDQWSNYQRGWWAYYGRAEERTSVLNLSGWIRRHIRKCFWQRWHSASGRHAALTRLGIPPKQREVARSSRGAWRMGGSPVMQRALNNRVLKRHGFITPSDLAG